MGFEGENSALIVNPEQIMRQTKEQNTHHGLGAHQ